jgi:hypothetical protein
MESVCQTEFLEQFEVSTNTETQPRHDLKESGVNTETHPTVEQSVQAVIMPKTFSTPS